MSRLIERQFDRFASARDVRVRDAFAFPYYYFTFSRVGRLPHARWEGNP